MALDIMPTSFWRRRKNIEAVSQAVVNDLGDDLLCDIFASVDNRRAVAPIYKRAVSLAAGRT